MSDVAHGPLFMSIYAFNLSRVDFKVVTTTTVWELWFFVKHAGHECVWLSKTEWYTIEFSKSQDNYGIWITFQMIMLLFYCVTC